MTSLNAAIRFARTTGIEAERPARQAPASGGWYA